jgi:hypothetical protein
LVNKEIVAQRGQGVTMGTQKSVPSSAKVVGEVRMGYGHEGAKKAGAEFEANIYPVDLFSPVARKREPLLTMPMQTLGGKTIDEYYEENHEPQFILIKKTSGKRDKIDIAALNAQLVNEYHLEPFKFGGPNGYIEFVERGKSHAEGGWLDDEERRSPDDENDQQGPDLSFPSIEVDPESQGLMATFTGGSVTKERGKFERKLRQMQRDFGNLASGIESGEDDAEAPEGMDPEHFDQLKALVLARNALKKSEKKLGGKASVAAEQGLDRYTPRKFSPEDMEIVLDLIQQGLAAPHGFAPHTWPETVWDDQNIFAQVDKSGKKWFAHLSDIAQKAIFDHLTRFRDQDVIISNDRWRNCLKPLLGERYKECNKNATLYASKLFDDGARANPDVYDQLTRVGYIVQQENPVAHISQLDEEPAPFTDDIEQQLLKQGYRWIMPQLASKNLSPEENKQAEATWDAEVEAGKPDWGHPLRQAKGAKLVYQQGDNKYDVVNVIMSQDGQLMFMVPMDQGTPGTGAEYDAEQQTMLMGGGRRGRITASQGKGHIESNPLRNEKAWEALKQELFQGKYGEPGGPYHDIHELPCVNQGIKIGYNYAARVPGMTEILPAPGSWEEKEISQNDYLAWAGEGLRGLSGDRAFKFGYLGKEVEKILGFNREEELEKHLAKEREPDPKVKKTMRGGYGIYVLLHKQGIEDPDEQDQIVQQVQEAIAQGADWDALAQVLPENILKAIGNNAYMARVRAISKMVRVRAYEVFYKMKKKKALSGETLKGDQEDGEGRGVDWTDLAQEKALKGKGGRDMEAVRQGVKDKSQYTDRDVMGVMSDEEKRRRAGLTTPATPGPAPPPKSEPAIPNRVTAATPGPAPAPKPEPAMGPAAATQPSQPTQSTGGAQSTGGLVRRSRPLGGLVRRNKMQKESRFMSWKEYTSVVYDPKVKVKDGCGFNVWGAAPTSHPLGVSIAGDANTSKKDPTGKGSHGRKRKRSSRT